MTDMVCYIQCFTCSPKHWLINWLTQSAVCCVSYMPQNIDWLTDWLTVVYSVLHVNPKTLTNLKKNLNRVTASVLKQDSNTKRFKQMFIYFDILCVRVKIKKRVRLNLFVFGQWLINWLTQSDVCSVSHVPQSELRWPAEDQVRTERRMSPSGAGWDCCSGLLPQHLPHLPAAPSSCKCLCVCGFWSR